MSPNSLIDSVYFHFEVFDPKYPDVKDSLVDNFAGVNNGAFFRQKIDITDVINLYPDTVAIVQVECTKGYQDNFRKWPAGN